MPEVRVGGAFHDPNDIVPRPQAEARNLFFERISEIAPGVMTSLRRNALPLFRHAVSIAGPTNVEGRWTLFYFSSEESSGIEWGIQLRAGSPEWRRVVKRMHRFDAVLDALETWGSRWCLADPWCIQVALDTLSAWTQFPAERRRPSLPNLRMQYLMPLAPNFTFTTGWFYDLLSEEEFRRHNVEA